MLHYLAKVGIGIPATAHHNKEEKSMKARYGPKACLAMSKILSKDKTIASIGASDIASDGA